MTTVLQARPKGFVNTPTIEQLTIRALRYLQSGFSLHLRGPAGTGKTTLAMHLADLLNRPIVLIFGDDELKSSDLIGNQLGYTRKKVVDNFIHSVVKLEDELRQISCCLGSRTLGKRFFTANKISAASSTLKVVCVTTANNSVCLG
jgi:MoxR-like ATPase